MLPSGAGRIFKSAKSPIGTPWMWTLLFGHHGTAHRRTAMSRRAKLRWQRSRSHGDESETG